MSLPENIRLLPNALESVEKFGIPRAIIVDTVKHHTQRHVVDHDGKRLVAIDWKRATKYSVLTVSAIGNDELAVWSVFKLYDDFIVGMDEEDPLNILKEIARRFGFPVRIGGRTSVFFLNSNVPLLANPQNIIDVLAPPHSGGQLVQFFRVNSDGDSRSVDCALVFCIDVNAYLNWLNAH